MEKILVRIETKDDAMVFCFKKYKKKDSVIYIIQEGYNHIADIISYLKEENIYLGVGIKEREIIILNKIINNEARYKKMKPNDIINELKKFSNEKQNIPFIDIAIVNQWEDMSLNTLKREFNYKDKVDETNDYIIIKGIINNILFIEKLVSTNQKKIQKINVIGKGYKSPLHNLTDIEILHTIFQRFYNDKQKRKQITFPEYLNNTKLEEIGKLITIAKVEDQLNILQPHSTTSVKINDIEININQGGIKYFKEFVSADTEEKTILQIDAVSYYPTIIMNNKLFPININKEDFFREYSNLIKERVQEEDQETKNFLKNIINKLYGLTKTNSQLFKDHKMFNAIVKIGQMTIIHLVESLTKVGPVHFNIINTDGLFITIKKENLEKTKKLLDTWSKLTNIQLKTKQLTLLAVNKRGSYFGIDEKNVFHTGDYKYDEDRFIHNKAVKSLAIRYMIDRIDYKEKINTAKKIEQFMLKQSAKKGNKIILVTPKGKEIEVKENSLFFFVTNKGYKMKIKNMKTGNESVYPYLINLPPKTKIEHINKDFYIKEVEKIIIH